MVDFLRGEREHLWEVALTTLALLLLPVLAYAIVRLREVKETWWYGHCLDEALRCQRLTLERGGGAQRLPSASCYFTWYRLS